MVEMVLKDYKNIKLERPNFYEILCKQTTKNILIKHNIYYLNKTSKLKKLNIRKTIVKNLMTIINWNNCLVQIILMLPKQCMVEENRKCIYQKIIAKPVQYDQFHQRGAKKMKRQKDID